jgi:microcompartment protein CcmK/EutM
MLLAQVVGTVVSTQRADSIAGAKYLLVQTCDQQGSLKGHYVVALDLVGAGVGEMVIIAQGSSARQTGTTFEKPIDAVIAGIVDMVEEEGSVVFRK